MFACVAAVAAQRVRRPVKIRLDRDDDFMITGKRHCFHYEYEVGYGDDGVIRAAKVEMAARAGFSADLSGPVCTRAVCHFDNTYFLPDVDILAIAGKTNTQSNTAFRGFGGPQGAIAIEYIIDNIARELGRDPLDIRKANFYGTTERNVTPYGMKVEDNVIHELVAELEGSSDYRQRRIATRSFNASSPVLKKGLALTPVKFGISFNVVHYNQAGALVHVYTDGSVLVSHGGTEMGQGLNTKVAQVVAHELGISLAHVRSTAADTSKVANTSATAASTGSDLERQGGAGCRAADQACVSRSSPRRRTAAGRRMSPSPPTRCRSTARRSRLPELVLQAYRARVQLWSDGFYATPKLHWDVSTMSGRPFFYFAYGAAVSEVIVDTLTGEWKLLRADLLHDAGDSINPAIDIGQVEGAFIQGMGWLTTEELWWNKDGVLMTHAPSTYKIPAVNDCPADFRTKLFRNSNVEDTILRSKATGEPPLLLPFSVFFAIRDAISSLDGVSLPSAARRTGDRRIDPEGDQRGAIGGARGGPMNDWIRTLKARTVDGRGAILVSIVAAKGSVPRSPGTRMIVSADTVDGTIGGGHLEHKAIAHRARSHRGSRVARASPLSAGREPRAVLRRCRAAPVRAGAWRCSLARDARGVCARRGSIARSSCRCAASASEGGLVVTRPWAFAARLARPGTMRKLRYSPASFSAPKRRARPGDARRHRMASKCSSTSLRVPDFSVVLFGAGHVGRAWCARSPTSTAAIRWVDTRDDAFPESIPDNVDPMTTDTPEAEVAAAPPGAYFLVMTHSHPLDEALVRVHSPSRRFRLFRPDRLAVEAPPVRKAAGGAGSAAGPACDA